MTRLPVVLSAMACAAHAACGAPSVIGHRGSAAAPENTLAAFTEAFRQGAHLAELDLHTTADNQIVVIHDATVDRTTDGTGGVAALTLSALKQLDAGSWFAPSFSGERIPTLAEVLALAAANDRGVLLDIKAAAASRVAQVMADAAFDPTRVTVLTWNGSQLSDYRTALPLAQILLTPWTQPGTWTDAYFEEQIAKGLDGLAFWYSSITRAFLDDAARFGLPVYAYTVNSPVDAQRLLDYGVSGFTTDYPAALVNGVDWNTALEIRSVVRETSGSLRIGWRAVQDDTYVVESSSEVSADGWSPVVTQAADGILPEAVVVLDSDRRFYRISKSPR